MPSIQQRVACRNTGSTQAIGIIAPGGQWVDWGPCVFACTQHQGHISTLLVPMHARGQLQVGSSHMPCADSRDLQLCNHRMIDSMMRSAAYSSVLHVGTDGAHKQLA